MVVVLIVPWLLAALVSSASVEPSADATGRAVAALFGPSAVPYLRSCPLPLVSYFWHALLIRHAVALVLGARLRVQWSAAETRVRRLRATLVLWVGYAAGAVAGACLVGLRLSGTTGGVREWLMEWSVAIGWMALVAALPALAVATIAARCQTGTRYLLTATALLLVLALLALGWNGQALGPVLPGAIEATLASGREPQRTHAILGAALWLGAALLLVIGRGEPGAAVDSARRADRAEA